MVSIKPKDKQNLPCLERLCLLLNTEVKDSAGQSGEQRVT